MRQDLFTGWNDGQSAQCEVRGAADVPIEGYACAVAVVIRGIADLFHRFNPQFSQEKIIDDILEIVSDQAHNDQMQGESHTRQ